MTLVSVWCRLTAPISSSSCHWRTLLYRLVRGAAHLFLRGTPPWEWMHTEEIAWEWRRRAHIR